MFVCFKAGTTWRSMLCLPESTNTICMQESCFNGWNLDFTAAGVKITGSNRREPPLACSENTRHTLAEAKRRQHFVICGIVQENNEVTSQHHLHRVTLMRWLSAAVAAHSRSPSIICPLSLFLAPSESQIALSCTVRLLCVSLQLMLGPVTTHR